MPKGVELSHKNIVSAIASLEERMLQFEKANVFFNKGEEIY